ncbi:hypothetical protein [Streptomyces fagopyri]|uniref:hypothetical protein n=1 Tax=Streptomyces fagopyri TaxID=2662397 RepID=UPI003813442D
MADRSVERTAGEWVRLPDDTVETINGQLRARGWEIEHECDCWIEVYFPDPDTGRAMGFSGWWLSWRLVDGQLAYGVGDDTADLAWRAQLAVGPDAGPAAVAEAADRAMHLLWHCDERHALSELHQKYSLLSALEIRMQELGRRLVVTPGMIRAALKPSGSWTP